MLEFLIIRRFVGRVLPVDDLRKVQGRSSGSTVEIQELRVGRLAQAPGREPGGRDRLRTSHSTNFNKHVFLSLIMVSYSNANNIVNSSAGPVPNPMSIVRTTIISAVHGSSNDAFLFLALSSSA